MSKKRKKGEQRQGTCIYCGRAGLITSDHVFPQAIFHLLDEHMITVPACDRCQQIKSLGDRDLRNYIVMDIGGSQHPDAPALVEEMLKESNVRLRNWLRKQIDNSEEVDLVTEDGIIVGKASTFDFNMNRIMVAQEMTVRGLYFYEKGVTLPLDCPVDVQYIPWQAAASLVKNLSAAAPTRIQTKGENTASWGYNTLAGGNQFDTVWQVFYNNWVLFMITTGQAAISTREHREAFRANQSIRPQKISNGRRQILVPRDPEGRPMIPPQ